MEAAAFLQELDAGLGIGILPLYMAGDALQQGQLVPVLRQFQVVPESAIYLVYLPNRTLSSRLLIFSWSGSGARLRGKSVGKRCAFGPRPHTGYLMQRTAPAGFRPGDFTPLIGS
jgi:LysR substrate binding domain